MREESLFLSITSGLAAFVHFALVIGFVIVVAVSVRRHRPDAWLTFLGAAIVELLGTITIRVLHTIGPMVIGSSGGYEHMAGFYAGTALLGTCVNVLFWVLLLVGLLKIAKPPQLDAVGAPPYR
jgi:hypothetical protein